MNFKFFYVLQFHIFIKFMQNVEIDVINANNIQNNCQQFQLFIQNETYLNNKSYISKLNQINIYHKMLNLYIFKNLTLKQCTNVNVLQIFVQFFLNDILSNKDTCKNVISQILHQDNQLESNFNKFTFVLEHYDCRTNVNSYSHLWSCTDCIVFFYLH